MTQHENHRRRGHGLGSFLPVRMAIAAALLLGGLSATDCRAQTTAFTYQGNLTDGGTRLGARNQVEYIAGGGRYNPVSNTWNPLASEGAPFPRYGHTTVWTGSEMIVFGGNANDDGLRLVALGLVNDGGRYRPATDSWEPLSLAEAPEARTGATGIWTGTELIVWGGTSQGVVPFLFLG